MRFHLRTAWWSGCRDLNPGPLRPERSALPSCATARSELPRSPISLAVGDLRKQRLDGARNLGFDMRVVLDHELADATLLDGLHAKRPVAVRIDSAGGRDLSREIEDETGDRDVFAFGNLEAKFLRHSLDVRLAVNEPALLANPHDRGLVVFVELVGEVSNQL